MSARTDRERVLELLYDVCSKPYDHAKEEYRYQKISSICQHIGAESTQYVRMILDDLELDGLVRGRINKNRSKSLYQITSKGYDLQGNTRAANVVDSTLWTGLPKEGILTEVAAQNLRDALKLVDHAVEQCDATNEQRAQAYAYVIALKALADAPQPPATIIRQMIYDAAAIAGIGALFIALVALYK